MWWCRSFGSYIVPVGVVNCFLYDSTTWGKWLLVASLSTMVLCLISIKLSPKLYLYLSRNLSTPLNHPRCKTFVQETFWMMAEWFREPYIYTPRVWLEINGNGFCIWLVQYEAIHVCTILEIPNDHQCTMGFQHTLGICQQDQCLACDCIMLVKIAQWQGQFSLLIWRFSCHWWHFLCVWTT